MSPLTEGDLEAALLANPDALKAYWCEPPYDSAWFRAVIDTLRAHARQGGDLLGALMTLLVREQARNARTLHEALDAARRNECPHCHRPLEIVLRANP